MIYLFQISDQVNCYSLNSVGPSVEKISGPGRFLAIYFSSAIASKGSWSYCNSHIFSYQLVLWFNNFKKIRFRDELFVLQWSFSWCIRSYLWTSKFLEHFVKSPYFSLLVYKIKTVKGTSIRLDSEKETVPKCGLHTLAKNSKV